MKILCACTGIGETGVMRGSSFSPQWILLHCNNLIWPWICFCMMYSQAYTMHTCTVIYSNSIAYGKLAHFHIQVVAVVQYSNIFWSTVLSVPVFGPSVQSLSEASPVSSVSADFVPVCYCKYNARCSHSQSSSGLLQVWEEALQDTQTKAVMTWGTFHDQYRQLQLSRRGCTPCLDFSPSFLSRSFLERVVAELSPALFFTFPFGSEAFDFVGLFISPFKNIRRILMHSTKPRLWLDS